MVVIVLVCFSLYYPMAIAADSCVDCHSKADVMKALGYPGLTVTAQEVKNQTHMPASCTDCHLGDAGSPVKEKAHAGLLSAKAVKQKTFEPVSRAAMSSEDLAGWSRLEPRGSKQATQLLPKRMKDDKAAAHPDYRAIILHDKNPLTLAFNPADAMKTCGKCHEDKVRGFLKSPMGGAAGAHTQSQYRAWTGPSGLQSCGLWVGALALPDQGSFTGENVKYYNAHSTMPVRAETAFDIQRNCNQCHVGCLDCHLDPKRRDGTPGSGAHNFTKDPSSFTCYGGGRSFSCHAGPLERRRGDGYIRGEFTQASPEGLDVLSARPDVHYKGGVACTQCHESNSRDGGHADLRRDVNCGKCHGTVVRDHGKGPHRRVDCASCHTGLIGGYAFNFWSATGPKGQENPITRIQDYLVSAVPPLIIKNPKNFWIPVHVVPHTSGNVKSEEVKTSSRLVFRNRPDATVDRRYRSNDSYAVTGLAQNVDDRDRDMMVWLNLDRVAHATGRSRACGDCHSSRIQRVKVPFSGGSYKDVEDGSYEIIADEEGLRVTNLLGPEGRPPAQGLLPFMDKWGIRGDFSLPEVRDKARFTALEEDYKASRFSH